VREEDPIIIVNISVGSVFQKKRSLKGSHNHSV
jgi:hypothetical protein